MVVLAGPGAGVGAVLGGLVEIDGGSVVVTVSVSGTSGLTTVET